MKDKKTFSIRGKGARRPQAPRTPKAPARAVSAVLSLLALSFLLIPFSLFADARPSDADTDALLLYCFNTDSILYEKKSGEKLPPSSTAKIMTALLTLEAYPDLSQEVTLTEELTANNISQDYGFLPNAALPVSDLLAALVIANANGAANILSRLIAGDETAFVEKMNERAAALGMKDTVYQNPTGLDTEGAYTTARDILLLAKTLHGDGRFTALASRASYTLTNRFTLYNRNALIGKWYTLDYYYARATGMNAGSTESGGHTLVATSDEPNGYTYLTVVLGGKTASDGTNTAYTTGTAFLKWGGTSFRYLEVLSSAKLVTTLPVRNGDGRSEMPVFPEKSLSLYLPDTVGSDDLTYTYTLTRQELEAPQEKGAAVGEITVLIDGEEAARVTLVTGADVTRSHGAFFADFLKRFFTNPFVLILLILCFLLILRKILIARRRARRKKEKERRLAERKKAMLEQKVRQNSGKQEASAPREDPQKTRKDQAAENENQEQKGN